LNHFNDLQLGNILLPGHRPFIIAEAGVNCENSIETALKMVEEAATAGADAIKFQSYKAGALASRFSPAYWDTTKEPTLSQYELFKKYDHFDDSDFIALAEKAKSCRLHFLSTQFDYHYADLLEPYMPFFKIASADITHFSLIKHCAAKGKPILLSVGASTLSEVDDAIAVIRSQGNDQIALLHCTLSYPCSPADANLATIPYLAKVYPQYVIGYSDHVPPSNGSVTLALAWILGARIIEKHFTLNKTNLGNDHYHAMDPDDLRSYRAQLDSVFPLMGRQAKQVLPCEINSRSQARRSLVAARDIKAGDTIRLADIAIKRPGTGIAPQYRELVADAQVTRDIAMDEILQWDMFLRTQ
jgi:N-acetylneuraminate synthase